MADFFGATTSDGRSESSMVDSIMMPILHSAMNRAHDRVRSRDGVLQRLTEQSKFCDLAVMQLDACVSCLQSADDDRGFHRQTTAYRNLVSDLTEIRDRLLGRLRETERAIADKDKELQRLRNWVRNQRSRKEEEKEHLKEEKSSVEEKKQADDLEREKGGGDIKSKSVQDSDQMGSEIYSLKRTLDVAMVVMQNAISVSEVRPFDLQFCWEMEKEIMTTLFAGFVSDFRFRSEVESVKSREYWSSLGASSFSGLMDDLRSLRSELGSLAGSVVEVESKNLLRKNRERDAKEEFKDERVNKVSMIIKTHESIINKESDKLDATSESCAKTYKETDELQRCVMSLIKKLDSLSKWNNKMDSMLSCVDNGKGPNHEKEISVNQPASEYNMERYDKPRNQKRLRIEDTEDLGVQVEINGDIERILLRGMMKDFQLHMHDHVIRNFIADGVCIDLLHETVTEVNKSIQKRNMRDKYTEELKLQDMISGEIQTILLTCVMKDFQMQMLDQVKGLISQGLSKDLVHGELNLNKSNEEKNLRGNNDTGELNLQLVISGEVQSILLRCATNDFLQLMHDHELMGSIREVMHKELLRETIKNEMNKLTEKMADQRKHNLECCTTSTDAFLRLELFEQVFKEALKCITSKFTDLASQNNELRTICNSLIASETRLHIESTVREIVYTTLLKEMANTWRTKTNAFRIKNTIEKQVYQSTILDTLKDTYAFLKRHESYNLDQSFQDCFSTKEKSNTVETQGSSSFIENLDSLLCYVEEESSELGHSSDNGTKNNAKFIRHDSKHEALMIEENNWEMDSNSTCDKFKKASMQPGTSKVLLKDLGSEHEAEVSDDDTDYSKPYCQRKSTTMQLKEGMHHSLCLEEAKLSKINQISGFGVSLGELSQLIANLENVLYEKFDFNFFRLERLKHQILQLVGLAAPLRRKEALYRQAFIRRCENLQKAETEVDILGDQVNSLLGLLERIYATIQYHAPSLQNCSGVLNILTLIKKELNGAMA